MHVPDLWVFEYEVKESRSYLVTSCNKGKNKFYRLYNRQIGTVRNFVTELWMNLTTDGIVYSFTFVIVKYYHIYRISILHIVINSENRIRANTWYHISIAKPLPLTDMYREQLNSAW